MRGNVIAIFCVADGSWSRRTINFCFGPYAKGTFIDCISLPVLSRRVITMSLNKLPNATIVFLNDSL